MTSTAIDNDWLLRSGKIGSHILRYLFLIVAVLAGTIAILALLTALVGLVRPDTIASIGEDPLELSEAFGLGALMTLLALGAWLLAKFFVLLAQIITTVGEGDPFIEENADRLHAMAMINLAIFGISLVAAAGILIYTGVYDIIVEDLAFHVALESLAVAVLLFILARVFRHGAAMREDLEGTV